MRRTMFAAENKAVYGICGAEMRKAAKPISRAASAADARQACLRKGGKARGGRRRRTPGPAGPGAAKLLQYLPSVSEGFAASRRCYIAAISPDFPFFSLK